MAECVVDEELAADCLLILCSDDETDDDGIQQDASAKRVWVSPLCAARDIEGW